MERPPLQLDLFSAGYPSFSSARTRLIDGIRSNDGKILLHTTNFCHVTTGTGILIHNL